MGSTISFESNQLMREYVQKYIFMKILTNMICEEYESRN